MTSFHIKHLWDHANRYGELNNGPELVCPICGFNYQHFREPRVIPGLDAYKAPWDGRGDLIIVPMQGECGHSWELCIGFHKGNSHIFGRAEKESGPQLESPIEEMFWNVAEPQIEGLTPQLEIGPYRVDFALPDYRTVIELDGHEYHKTKEQRTHDAKRERYLQENGWEVIRFTGSEIYKDTAGCVKQVVRILGRKKPRPPRDDYPDKILAFATKKEKEREGFFDTKNVVWWSKFLESIRESDRSVHALLRDIKFIKVLNSEVLICSTHDSQKSKLEEDRAYLLITRAISKIIGKPMDVNFIGN
jgi:very-short-patch-repair endonuclease